MASKKEEEKARRRRAASSAHFQKIVERHREFKRAYALAEKLWGKKLANRDIRKLTRKDAHLLQDHGFAYLTSGAPELALTSFGMNTLHGPIVEE